MNTIVLPGRYAGKNAAQRKDDAYRAFADQLMRLEQDQGIDFKESTRGWCYTMEDLAGLTKDQFDMAESRIVYARLNGYLPIDFTATDDVRLPKGDHGLREDYDDLDKELEWIWADLIKNHVEGYTPINWFDYQEYYLEVLVEKIDLVGLFAPVANPLFIAVSNARGDTDLSSIARMHLRFQEAEARGQKTVLLYCGDHDPKGLHISKKIRDRFTRGVGGFFMDGKKLAPINFELVRFGLNADFIEDNRLSKINNLITGGTHKVNGKTVPRDLADPNHPDRIKKMPYIVDYLRDHGPWKVEANALVVRPKAGRELLACIIDPYIDKNGKAKYERTLKARRKKLKAALPDYLRGKLS